MKRSSQELPTEVMQALEVLEAATSPTDLGPAYQTLLAWRRRRPASVFALNAMTPALVLAGLGALYLSISFIDIPVTDFWRGVHVGLMIALAATTVQNMIWPRPTRPASAATHIEAAIDRWRSLVPVMREIPR